VIQQLEDFPRYESRPGCRFAHPGYAAALRHYKPTGRANARPMTGSSAANEDWIASPQVLLAIVASFGIWIERFAREIIRTIQPSRKTL
jgi:hypothetical protein